MDDYRSTSEFLTVLLAVTVTVYAPTLVNVAYDRLARGWFAGEAPRAITHLLLSALWALVGLLGWSRLAMRGDFAGGFWCALSLCLLSLCIIYNVRCLFYLKNMLPPTGRAGSGVGGPAEKPKG